MAKSSLTMNSGLQSEEFGYPPVASNLSLSVPFPETFDPILQLSRGGQYGGSIQEEGFRFADDGDAKIDTMVFPEAKSASLLYQVLEQMTVQPSVAVVPRETLHAAIIAHARTIVSTPWKDGSRFAALGFAYT